MTGAGITPSPPGWYPDPWAPSAMRWWDGMRWTQHQALPAPPPAAPLTPLPFAAAFGALLALAIPLALGRPVLSELADRDVPSLVYIVVATLLSYGPSLWWWWFASRRYGTGHMRADVGLKMRPVDLGWGPLAWLSCVLTQVTVFGLVTAFDVPFESNTGGIRKASDGLEYVIPVVLLVVIVAPFVEEIVFRGVILRGFLSVANTPVAIGLQGVLFGAAHFDPDRGVGNIGLIMVLSGVGVVLGATTVLSKRLAPSILAHAIINGIAVAVALSGWDPQR